ncbi:MAG: GC-type dockerin domain-anchored protein [Planctomycetota bacterium]
MYRCTSLRAVSAIIAATAGSVLAQEAIVRYEVIAAPGMLVPDIGEQINFVQNLPGLPIERRHTIDEDGRVLLVAEAGGVQRFLLHEDGRPLRTLVSVGGPAFGMPEGTTFRYLFGSESFTDIGTFALVAWVTPPDSSAPVAVVYPGSIVGGIEFRPFLQTGEPLPSRPDLGILTGLAIEQASTGGSFSEQQLAGLRPEFRLASNGAVAFRASMLGEADDPLTITDFFQAVYVSGPTGLGELARTGDPVRKTGQFVAFDELGLDRNGRAVFNARVEARNLLDAMPGMWAGVVGSTGEVVIDELIRGQPIRGLGDNRLRNFTDTDRAFFTASEEGRLATAVRVSDGEGSDDELVMGGSLISPDPLFISDIIIGDTLQPGPDFPVASDDDDFVALPALGGPPTLYDGQTRVVSFEPTATDLGGRTPIGPPVHVEHGLNERDQALLIQQTLSGAVLVRASVFRPCSRADLTATGGTIPGTVGYREPDRVVDLDDFGAYIGLFLANDPEADVGTTDQTNPLSPLFGEPDGSVDLDDLAVFLQLWFVGCI